MPRRDRDTFDSRPKRHSRHSDPEEPERPERPERPRRHSRHSRHSQRSQELWPPEWSQVEPQEPVNQAERNGKKKGKCCKRIRLYISVLFLLAYLALVGLLMSMILSEKKLLEAPGKDSAECREKICPIESPCQIQENEARCVFVSLANLRALEVISGLVIGVPLVICIPCTLHCVIRRVRGKSWGPKTSKSTKSSQEAKLAHPAPSVLGRAEEDVESQDSTQALKTSMAPAPDDGLEDLFTRLAKSPAEEATKEAENELDLLFAPKPKGYTKKDDPTPYAPPSIISSALESEFSALFHQRKPKGKGKGRSGAGRQQVHGAGESDAASDLHSNFSEGMSVLFASLKRLQTKDGASAAAHALVEAQARSTASSDHRKLAPKVMSTIGESEDWLDAIDLGDPPDFFQFAVQIARRATGNIRDEDPLERRDSDDSLGHLEEDDLAELFHPPL